MCRKWNTTGGAQPRCKSWEDHEFPIFPSSPTLPSSPFSDALTPAIPHLFLSPSFPTRSPRPRFTSHPATESVERYSRTSVSARSKTYCRRRVSVHFEVKRMPCSA